MNEEKEPKERKKYMETNKEDLPNPPEEKEGIEEPRVKDKPKIQKGVFIFVVIVLIILIGGIAFDMFGLFNN